MSLVGLKCMTSTFALLSLWHFQCNILNQWYIYGVQSSKKYNRLCTASLSHFFALPRQLVLTVPMYPSRGQVCLWSLIKALCSLGFSLASRGAATSGHRIRASGPRARTVHILLSLCWRAFPGQALCLEGQHLGCVVCDICSHSIDLTHKVSEVRDLIDSHQPGKVGPRNCWARTCQSKIMEKCPWSIQNRNQIAAPVY